MTFFWSEFLEKRDGFPKQFSVNSWQEFVDTKLGSREKNKKTYIGLWCPARFREIEGEARRKQSHLEAACAIVFDFDSQSDEYAAALIQRLLSSGLIWLLHSSWSHQTPGKTNCFRVIFPLAREASPGEWRATREALMQTLQLTPKQEGMEGGYDSAPSAPNAIFHWPSHVPDSPTLWEHHSEGRFVEVESAGAFSSTKILPLNEGMIVGEKGQAYGFLQHWATGSRKNGDERANGIPQYGPGFIYDLLKDGKPLAEDGFRDNTIQSMMWSIANRMDNTQLSGTDEQIILDFMAASIAATPGVEGDRITAEDVASKLRRARRDVKFQRDHGVKEPSKLIAAMFQNPTVLSDEEMPKKVLMDNAPKEEQWTEEKITALGEKYFNGGRPKCVFSYLSSYIVFSETGFSRWLKENEVPIWVIQSNLRAAGVQVYELSRRSGDKAVLKSARQLAAEYGGSFVSVRGAFTGHSRYDASTGQFTEVVNPMRDIPAVFHADIHEFLKTFCADPGDFPRLQAWLARFPDMNLASNILHVYGRKNTGKTLISAALARFWGQDKGADPEDYFGNFQDILLNCPYIVADEGLPPSMTSSQAVRSLATKPVQSINRKGIPKIEVDGYLRMMISSNDAGDLKFSDDDLNRDMIEATEVRFLRIAVADAAAAYIEEMGGREWTNQLVQGNRFAQHVRWLNQEFNAPPGLSADARFPATNSIDNVMHTKSKLLNKYSEPIGRFIYHLLYASKQELPVKKAWEEGNIVFRADGNTKKLRLLLHVQLLNDETLWKNAMQGDQRLQRPNITTARTVLALYSERIQTRNNGSNAVRYYSLNFKEFADLLNHLGHDTGVFLQLLVAEAEKVGAIAPDITIIPEQEDIH